MARIESVMNQPVHPTHQQQQQQQYQPVVRPQYIYYTIGSIMMSVFMISVAALIVYGMEEEGMDVIMGGFLIFMMAMINFMWVYYMMDRLGQQQLRFEEEKDFHIQTLEEKTMAVLGKFQMVHEKYEETEKKYVKLQKKYFKVQTELEQERRKKLEPVISDGNGTGVVEHPTDP